jgi:predicted dehydrogenase
MAVRAVTAQGRHVPASRDTPGLELFAVDEPDEGRRRRCTRGLFEIPHVFADPEPFFESGIELVSVLSPASFHRENILGAARHGLPALCEKPLSTTREGALDMIAAMKEAGAPLFTAFCYRFSPVALQIRELVRNGAIGEVRSLRLVYTWGAHGRLVTGEDGGPLINAWRAARMLEGGPLVDCGVHQIDLARFWLGSEVVRFSASAAWVDDFEAPDHVWLHMDHASGAHTTVEVSYSYYHTTRRRHSEFQYEIIGTGGVIRYDRGRRAFTLDDARGTHSLQWDREKNFHGLYEALARFLETGESSLLGTADDGLWASEIAIGATEQARARRRGTDGCP